MRVAVIPYTDAETALNQLYDKYGLDKKIKKEDLNPSVQEFLNLKKQSENEN